MKKTRKSAPKNLSRKVDTQDEVKLKWNDHPWVIALASGGATALFCTTVFMTVVLPTWTKMETNRLDEMEKSLAMTRRDRDQIANRQSKATSDLRQASRELLECRVTPMFPDRSPYPRGFRSIKIGDQLQAVSSLYGASARDEEFWVSVTPTNSIFSSIAYYRQSGDKTSVAHILFQASDIEGSRPADVIKSQLVDAFGLPDKEAEKRKGHRKYCWRVGELDVEVDDVGLHLSPSANGSFCS